MSNSTSENSAVVQTNLAVAALAIALVALVTTVLQVVQQFFATADGYRRCQPSVLGPWARYTRLRWRYSEMRFETLFTTLEFRIREISHSDGVFLTGAWEGNGLESDLMPSDEEMQTTDEEATWLQFLSAIQLKAEETATLLMPAPELTALRHVLKEEVHPRGRKASQRKVSSRLNTREVIDGTAIDMKEPSLYSREIRRLVSMPNMLLREKSWDFMPRDVVRPFASTTVGEIGSLARRLGMKWTDFRPSEGVMKAEGGGHLLVSTLVRGVGVMLQYQYTGIGESQLVGEDDSDLPSTAESHEIEVYIPRSAVDSMGFGILPGNSALGVTSFNVANIEGAMATMRKLGCSSQAMDELKRICDANPHWTPGFSDIIGMAAPVLRLRRSTLIQVPAPTDYFVGLTYEREGFKIFHHRLQQLIQDSERRGEAVSSQLRSVLKSYEVLRDNFSMWEDEHQANRTAHTRPLAFLDQVNECWDETSIYFKELHESRTIRYLDLVTCHIEHAVNWWAESHRKQNSFAEREHYDLIAWIAEGMHMYFDSLPAMREYMQRKGVKDGNLVTEAWVTLVFRAFCWHRLHYIVKGPIIPHIYWDSQLPVYIE